MTNDRDERMSDKCVADGWRDLYGGLFESVALYRDHKRARAREVELGATADGLATQNDIFSRRIDELTRQNAELRKNHEGIGKIACERTIEVSRLQIENAELKKRVEEMGEEEAVIWRRFQ